MIDLPTPVTFNYSADESVQVNSIFSSENNDGIVFYYNTDVPQYQYISEARIIAKSNEDIILEELEKAVALCNVFDWDDNKGMPLSQRAISNAKKFISYIENFGLPEINPYPNSDIGFQWNKNDDLLNVIFNGENQVIFVISQNKKVTSGFFNFDNIDMVKDIVKVFTENV